MQQPLDAHGLPLNLPQVVVHATSSSSSPPASPNTASSSRKRIADLCLAAIQEQAAAAVANKEQQQRASVDEKFYVDAVQRYNAASSTAATISEQNDLIAIMADEFFLACSEQPKSNTGQQQISFCFRFCDLQDAVRIAVRFSGDTNNSAAAASLLDQQQHELERDFYRAMLPQAQQIVVGSGTTATTPSTGSGGGARRLTSRTFLDINNGLVIQNWGANHAAARRHVNALKQLATVSCSGSTSNSIAFTVPLCALAEVRGFAVTATAAIPPQSRQLRANSLFLQQQFPEWRFALESIIAETSGGGCALFSDAFDLDDAVSGNCRFAAGADGRTYCLNAVGLTSEMLQFDSEQQQRQQHFSLHLLQRYDGPILENPAEQRQQLVNFHAACVEELVAFLRSNVIRDDNDISEVLEEACLEESDLPLVLVRLNPQGKSTKRQPAAMTAAATSITESANTEKIVAELIARTLHAVLLDAWAQQRENSLDAFIVEMSLAAQRIAVDAFEDTNSKTLLRSLLQLGATVLQSEIGSTDNLSLLDNIKLEPAALIPRVGKRLAQLTGLTFVQPQHCLVFSNRAGLGRLVSSTAVIERSRLLHQPVATVLLPLINKKIVAVTKSTTPALFDSFDFFLVLRRAELEHLAAMNDSESAATASGSAIESKRQVISSFVDPATTAPDCDSNSMSLLFRHEFELIAAMQRIATANQLIAKLASTTTPQRIANAVNIGIAGLASVTASSSSPLDGTLQFNGTATATASSSPLSKSMTLEARESAMKVIEGIRQHVEDALPAVRQFFKTNDELCFSRFEQQGENGGTASATTAILKPGVFSNSAALLSLLTLGARARVLIAAASALCCAEQLRPFFSRLLDRLESLATTTTAITRSAATPIFSTLCSAAIALELNPLTPELQRDAPALNIARRRTEFAEKVFGRESLEWAASLADTGALSMSLGDLASAHKWYSEAFYKHLLRKYPDRVATLSAASQLGTVLFRQAHELMQQSDKRSRIISLRFVFPAAVDDKLVEAIKVLNHVVEQATGTATAASNNKEEAALLLKTRIDTFNTIGSICVYRGQYAKGRDYFSAALQLTDSSNSIIISDSHPLRAGSIKNRIMCDKRIQASACIRIACMWRRLQARRELRRLKMVRLLQRFGRGLLERRKLKLK